MSLVYYGRGTLGKIKKSVNTVSIGYMPDDSGRKPAFLNISEYDFCSLQLSIRVYCLLRRSEQTGFSEVSRPEEFHLQTLAELYGSLSAHTAPIIQPSRCNTPLSNVQMHLASFPPEVAAFCSLWFYVQSNAYTFSSSSVPGSNSCASKPAPLLSHKIACNSSSTPTVLGWTVLTSQ